MNRKNTSKRVKRDFNTEHALEKGQPLKEASLPHTGA
jgi:hypothetical protein